MTYSDFVKVPLADPEGLDGLATLVMITGVFTLLLSSTVYVVIILRNEGVVTFLSETST